MRLKFIGKFTDLKGMGYTFHKLYAMNYKVYMKDGILIWVAGRDVEFNNIDHSAKIAKMILDGTYPVYEEDTGYGDKDGPGLYIFFKKGGPLSCVINKKTGEVIIHKTFIEEHGYDYDRDLYQESFVKQKLMEAVKELKDMIEIRRE
jgi:hypothetical protein